MRDPDRIPLILQRIEQVWERYPDLRLGQLLLNIESEEGLFYIEDEELARRIEDFFDNLEIQLEQE